MPSDPEVRFEVSRPRVVAETLGGEVVAIDLDTGSYYSLVGTGAAIWQGIERSASVGDIVAEMGGSADAPEAVAASVAAFVGELQREGLIRPATNGNSSAPTADPTPDPPSGQPFEAPRLEKFTDLEDLLLLDPVHDVDARGWPHASSD